MNETDVIKIIRNYVSTQFSRKCNRCEKQYESFAEFIRHTRFFGKPITYGAEISDSKSKMPFTAIDMVNCSCGTTIGISTKNMGLWARFKITSHF